jgi:hypothetical protein
MKNLKPVGSENLFYRSGKVKKSFKKCLKKVRYLKKYGRSVDLDVWKSNSQSSVELEVVSLMVVASLEEILMRAASAERITLPLSSLGRASIFTMA